MLGPVNFMVHWWNSNVDDLQVKLKGISRRPPMPPPFGTSAKETLNDYSKAVMPVLHLFGRPVPACWVEHAEDDVAGIGVARLLLGSETSTTMSEQPVQPVGPLRKFQRSFCIASICFLPITQQGSLPGLEIYGLVVTAPVDG